MEYQYGIVDKVNLVSRYLRNLAGFYYPYNLRYGVEYYGKDDFQSLGNR